MLVRLRVNDPIFRTLILRDFQAAIAGFCNVRTNTAGARMRMHRCYAPQRKLDIH